MLLYRVFFHDGRAAAGEPGSPDYLHRPQGKSRWDNPHLYDAWYLARSPEGAVGEAFGNLSEWSEGMFDTGMASRRALATFDAPDDCAIFDFDDPANLLRLGMRPSAVVIRNAPVTQAYAASLFAESNPDGTPRWEALQWWSHHAPTWQNLMLWSRPAMAIRLRVVDVTALDISSPAVVAAAKTLRRRL